MKGTSWCGSVVFLAAVVLLLVPAPGRAQQEPGPPPIAQQLVREGDFAIKLTSTLGLGAAQDEAEAESGLGRAGILPRNGWIADYPVTPDILGELQQSLGDAAAQGKLPLERAEALRRLDAASAELGLGIKPQTSASAGEVPRPEPVRDYPNPAIISDYYQDEGPPIVTYYAPPPDYYYLYGWIPYPFWSAGLWFPGYFILHDFHRSLRGHRGVAFVSNHFNDIRRHRVFRVDPVARFNGRTFAGIGVTGRRGFISTGVPRSQRTIFNAPRAQAAPGMRPLPGMRSSFRSSAAGGVLGPAVRAPAGTFAAPHRGGARTLAAPGGPGRTSFAPPGGAGRTGAPSGGRGGGALPRR